NRRSLFCCPCWFVALADLRKVLRASCCSESFCGTYSASCSELSQVLQIIPTKGDLAMSLGTILLIILILILVGALPNWGYSRGWGYGPSGILGVLVVVLL